MSRGQELIDYGKSISDEDNLKSANCSTNGHWWICPTCKVANLHNRMFCGMCGYTGHYATPRPCTEECYKS